MCRSLKSRRKIHTRNPLFFDLKVVQSHQCWHPGKLVSSAFFGDNKTKTPCYDKQQVCVCLSATILMLDELIAVKQRFLMGVPLSSMPSLKGNILTQHHEIWSQQTGDSESLSQLSRFRVVTDGRTDGQNYDS